MAAGHVLAVLLQISLVFLNTFYIISATKCADKDCKVPISVAVAVENFESADENYLSFKKGDVLYIYGKYVERDNSIWQGSLQGMAAKFLKSDLVREKAKLVSEDKLIDVSSNSASEDLLKDDQPLESHQHADEVQEVTNEDESVADMLESRDISNEDPVPSNTDDQTRAEHQHPANDAANKAPKENAEEATQEVANEGKDDAKPGQEELRKENEMETIQFQPENVPTNDVEALDHENNNHQVTMDDNDEGVDDRTKKTEVYTDPRGVQYDVQIEYLDPADEGDKNDDVKVVGVTEQPQPNVDETNGQTNKAVDDKGNTENPETPSNDKDDTQLKKAGFFSSVRNLVSDFTENIIKDFQGEQQNDKETKDHEAGGTEGAVHHGITDDGEKQGAGVESQKDETNTKPSLHERFQQIKAARLEKMKDEEMKKESIVSSEVDEEEILKEKAKRTVEEIPGLMKEEKNGESEMGDEEMKNKNTVSQGKSGGTSSQKAFGKQYSDKVLCKSVPVKEREICLENGSKEECLQENCCFDESAVPGQQCFFKPSAPESGFTDEELQKLLSDDDEKVGTMNNENDVEISDLEKSTIAEQTSTTADVSSETKKELNDVESDNAKKLESVEERRENGDETEISGEKKLVESVEKTNDHLKSTPEVNVPANGVYESNSSNENHESSPKDSLSEKSATTETVDSTTSTKEAEEKSSEGRDNNNKQGDTSVRDSAEQENIEDKAKSGSEETEDSGKDVATGTKTSLESGDHTDISNEEKTTVNKQQSSGGSVLTDETSVDSQEARRGDSDSEGVDAPATAGSRVEDKESSMENVAEEQEVKSAQDSEDDESSSQVSPTTLGDVEEKAVSSGATSKDEVSADEKVTSEGLRSGEKEDEHELKHSLKKEEKNEESDGEAGDEDKEVGAESADQNKEVVDEVVNEGADDDKEVVNEGGDKNTEVGVEGGDEKREADEGGKENKEVIEEGDDENKEVDVGGGDKNRNGKETEADDEYVALRSNSDDPKRKTSLQDQEPSGQESISTESNEGESQRSEAKTTEAASKADEFPHQVEKEDPTVEDSSDTETAAETSSVKDAPEEEQETLSEDNVGKKSEEVPDSEGILAAIRKFLPGGGSKKEDTKSKGETSDEVLDVKKPKLFEEGKAEGSQNDDDQEKVPNDSQDNDNGNSIMNESGTTEDVKNDEAILKDVHLQESSETNANEPDAIKEVSGEDFDKSETSVELEAERMLRDILEEASSNIEGATALSDVIIPDTKEERERESKSVQSGSTRFFDVSETTLPVDKTVGVNDSTSQGTDEVKTEIKETRTGIEETGLNGTKLEVNKTSRGIEAVVPSKTSAVGSSETITPDHRPEEKKFANIASKWMKNKFMKGKRMAEKEETSEGMDEKLGSKNVDKDQHTSNLDRTLDLEDPHTGTCFKDGTCEGGETTSSGKHSSVSVDDDDLADDDIVESSPPKEEPEVKSVKGMLAVAVGTFEKYHDFAAQHGLQVLKPVGNVVKSLGEEMGLGETIDYVGQEIEHGPRGVISVPLILIAFLVYFALRVLCGERVPPAYGPNLKDIFKTYEGRIRILEEECESYEEEIDSLKNKADAHGENSSALEKQLEDEKYERNKSNEKISLLEKIRKELDEKIKLLEEESSNLKQSLAQKVECVNAVKEELSEKSNKIEALEQKNKQLEGQLKEKDGEKSDLNEKIEEYKIQLSKAEDDTDRHKTMLQEWNDRYHELQQKNDDISVNNQTLEEQIHFKDNEIEVLREALVQINSDVHVNSDEELPQEEMQEAKAKKVKELMDVSQIRTDYKLCKEEKEKLEDDIKEEVDKREKLEGEVEQLEIDLAKSKASEEEFRFKYREADIKLNALQDYFKNMESDLHRKLTAEEAARMASESELERKLREASTAVQDVELYRKQVEELRKEIDETQLSFRSQISSTEERAHENWLKFRTAERELEEMKRERDALRRRLYDLETTVKAPAPLEDSVTSTPADNTESPVPRSESPATSTRSSKRKSSNTRKSPSSSPMDERKERVRRKTRDKNSPPSWEPDVGPPPRRRDKDRETPPPPPPLWEPNMGSRRKGQRESPGMDIEHKRRDRYTPSPPPPPLETMNSNSRRRRRDRPTPSSPPPPPPGHMLPPRGVGLPFERSSSPPPPPPPAHVLSPGGVSGMPVPPMRPQAPMMAPQPIRNGVPRGPFDNTPPQEYVGRGVGIPEQRLIGVRGPPPTSEFQGTSPARYVAGPPLATTISPLRGVQPQGVASNEQPHLYNNSSLSNNTPVEEQPPPPPLFASNGPYRRPPPRKIQTQPS